mmetsp:Transcript_222/g.276  ORF Transcript_222/g.276 Transcript_222/m.276 type:complete len:107 (+) Transcript_222:377-697(+)
MLFLLAADCYSPLSLLELFPARLFLYPLVSNPFLNAYFCILFVYVIFAFALLLIATYPFPLLFTLSHLSSDCTRPLPSSHPSTHACAVTPFSPFLPATFLSPLPIM